jgi:hypothetical protein
MLAKPPPQKEPAGQTVQFDWDEYPVNAPNVPGKQGVGVTVPFSQ